MADLTPGLGAKALEYLIALTFLASFPLFWRYVMSGGAPLRAPEGKQDVLPAFPDGLLLHPGHVWARLEGSLARVGLDDFGQRLVGRVEAVTLPAVGEFLRRGEPAFTLCVDGKELALLAPLDGHVVAVNAALAEGGAALVDSYARGWLCKLKPTNLRADVGSLLSGARARRFLREALDLVLSQGSSGVVTAAYDGGTPVHGFGRVLCPDDWEALARRHFLTLTGEPPCG